MPRAAHFAFGAGFFLLAAHVVTRAARDALFLSHFPVTDLPRMMIAAATAMLLAAALVSWLLTRVAPGRLVPAVFLVSALLFLGESFLLGVAPGIASIAVYLHFAGFGAVLMSGFWSVVNERFDPHTGKAVVARIGGFGALGGLLGGVAAHQLAPLVGIPALLRGLAVFHLAAGLAVRGIGAPAGSSAELRVLPAAGAASGLRVLRRSPYLLQMAALIAMLGIVEELIDYAFKVEATARHRDGAALLEFFALFYTAAYALAFAFQTAFGRLILQRLGLGGAIALLPSAVALGALGASFLTRLWTVTVARGANAVIALSVFRSGFELLYTPVAPEAKRPAKAYVDVAADSLGDMSGGLLILGLLLLMPALPTQVVLLLVVAACGVALLLVARLHRGYVRQLAENLRSGVVSLEDRPDLDATTARTLSESRVTIDRAELQARLRELGSGAPQVAGGAPGLPVEIEAFLERVRGLASGDVARARAALSAGRGEPALIPHVLRLLERSELRADALSFLRSSAPRAVGQLTDALVDPGLGVVIRRRIPRALEGADDRYAVEGLCRGLESEDFDVRLQAARSAARIVGRHPELALSPEAAVGFAERELAAEARTWEHQGRRREEGSGESVLLESADLVGVTRSVEQVFTLLALGFGVELMGSTLRALHCGEANLRGTALEYLQAVLPERACRALWPRIPTGTEGRRPRRATQQIEDELLRSSVAIRPLRPAD